MPSATAPSMAETRALLQLLAARPAAPGVLATLVGVEGSSYRRPGARLLWFPDGAWAGSVSGGCLESDLFERARAVLAGGRPEAAVYDTTAENDLVWGTGTGCHGRVRVLLEPLPAARPAWLEALRANQAAQRDTALAVVHGGSALPLGTRLAAELPAGPDGALVFRDEVPAPASLVVFGAGDDAQPLVRFAAELGWHVTVVDARPAYATAERFPSAAAVVVAAAAEALARVAPGPRAFAVVMTHRYRDDAALLHALVARPLSYLGVLGPRARTERLLEEVRRAGRAVPPEARARLFAPVGLDLGGETPAAIALAVLAEMQAHRAGRTPGFLRDRAGPIHG